jgi:hypothetical protein
MSKLTSKPNSMIQDSIINAVKAFAVKGKFRIIGSNSTRSMLYGVDYDANSKIQGVDMLTHIQNLYKHPPAIITDFKTGDLHWSKEQVLKGKHGNALLKDELIKVQLIKVDFVVVTVGGLAECSEVYYTKDQPKKDIIKQLENDIDDYLNSETLKSIKRLVSILSLKKGNEKLIQECLDFFNSEIGLVNYCISNLETLELVKDRIDVKPYRELVKEQLGRTSVVPTKYVKGTYANIPHLRKIVNDASTDFLREMLKNTK